MLKIGNVELKNRVCIAPMAGITDLPYRLILKEMGASLMTTELVSAKGLKYKNENTYELMITDKKESPIALQLFGNDPDIISDVAKDVYQNYDIIDINMGCPVKKVVNNGEGSALLKDIDLSKKIIDKLVKTVGKYVPITCKIRIGFDLNNINAVPFAKAMEDVGISAITVHGRTRSEFYSGECHLDVIKEVKNAVKVPIIANGNIFTIYDAKKMILETNCDGIALARGVKGNPWLVKECIEYLDNDKIIDRPSIDEIKNMMIRHIDDTIKLKGEERAISELKHHIIFYVNGLKDAKNFRLSINNVKTYKELINKINNFFENLLNYN